MNSIGYINITSKFQNNKIVTVFVRKQVDNVKTEVIDDNLLLITINI